jgi:hypothetical protein
MKTTIIAAAVKIKLILIDPKNKTYLELTFTPTPIQKPPLYVHRTSGITDD